MRILHVTPGISRLSGGPSRSVQGLVAGLNRSHVETWLMTLNAGEYPWVDGVEHFVNGGEFEKVLLRIKPHIVHLHSIWDFKIHRCASLCRQFKVPYVIAPRGMLEPWSLNQKWLKKRIARWLYQDEDLRKAVALHATAESEANQFKKLGFNNHVIVSPNGVNVPSKFVCFEHNNQAARRVLFISRMHPKKGVLELVKAWAKCRPQSWVCELVYTINGNFEREYESRVKAFVQNAGLSNKIIFTGPMDDERKWDAYARADLFVLPTYSENFGIVVAEALWAGVPVITTKGTPWVDLDKCNCGWWIEVGVEPLAVALKNAFASNETELHEMGVRGRALVEEKYSWDVVANKMVSEYEMLMNSDVNALAHRV